MTRVFGPVPVPGLDHVAVDDLGLARRLGDADGRINRTGASLSEGGRLRIGSAPGLAMEPISAADSTELARAVVLADDDVPTAVEVDLGFDLVDDLPPVEERTRPNIEMRLTPEQRLVVLAGPGVLRSGMLDTLQRFAADTHVGVLNTWGAKGVFPWDSPHHLGTAGLQERDFELGGLGDADLVVAMGVDLEEAPLDLLPPVDILNIDLRYLAWDVVADARPIPRPPLYTDLSAVVMPAYQDESIPLHPARAARDLRAVLRPRALVVADPGPAGFWVARTFPTTEPGSVIVPALRAPGFAAAAALVAALDGRPAIAITASPVNDETLAVVQLAEALGLPLVVEAWGGDGPVSSPEHRGERARDALEQGGVHVLDVPVDFARTRELVEVAGPVVAWTRGTGGFDRALDINRDSDIT